MQMTRASSRVRRIWAALAVAWAAATIAFTGAMDRHFFADTSQAFRLNAALVWVVPSTLFAVAVAGIARGIGAIRHPAGPRLGVRGMMVAVALIGSCLGTVRWWVDRNFATVYASGYDEGRFRLVRVGITPAEVEATLGRPLRSDNEKWIYSEPPPPGTIGDNYWRRWVIFRDGLVIAIVDDYYED